MEIQLQNNNKFKYEKVYDTHNCEICVRKKRTISVIDKFNIPYHAIYICQECLERLIEKLKIYEGMVK